MADDFFREIQGAAVLKHALLSRYLRAYVQKVGSTTPDKTVGYIDGYAGPGFYDDGSPGSPILASKVAAVLGSLGKSSHLDAHFVEADRKSCDQLRSHLATAGHQWPVYQGDIESHLAQILDAIGEKPLFAFLDPYGLNIPAATISDRLLARAGKFAGGWRSNGKATEVLLNFSLSGVRRVGGHLDSKSTEPKYVKARPKLIERMDNAMGGDWWHNVWREPGAEREVAILDEYVKRITRGGWSAFKVPVTDQLSAKPEYFLILLTQHPDGMWLFNGSLSSALEEHRTWCHERAGQFDLESLASRERCWIEEIKANLLAIFEQRSSVVPCENMQAIFGEALGYARETHLRTAVKELFDEGRTSTNCVGVKTLARLRIVRSESSSTAVRPKFRPTAQIVAPTLF